MTREELISVLTAYASDDYTEAQSSLVEAIIDDAIEEVRKVQFPFGTIKNIEKMNEYCLTHHSGVIRRIAEYHYDKIGKEGVTTFYESGQTTSWESGGTPDSYFKGIIPIAKLV